MFHNMHNLSKPNIKPSIVLSKSNLIQWLRNILSINDVPNNIKIQDLGTGVIFCKLVNHYFPHAIPINRIINYPKNQYENNNNLKLLQNALVQLKITISIDVGKISKMRFLQNWNLLNALYKHFNNHNDLQISTGVNDDCSSISGSINLPTFGNLGNFCTSGTASVSKIMPKRSFQNSFSKQHKKLIKDKDIGFLEGKQSLMKSSSMKAFHHFNDIKNNNCETPQNISSNINNINRDFQHINNQVYDSFHHITPKQSTIKVYKEDHLENIHFNGLTSPFLQPINSPKINSNNANYNTQNNISSFNFQCPFNNYLNLQLTKPCSPIKGKWSVSSNFFQSNHHAIIDRVKQILLKSSNDTEKIRQAKMLVGLPIDQDLIKIQDQAQNYDPVCKKIIQKDSNKRQMKQIKEQSSQYEKIIKEDDKQNSKQDQSQFQIQKDKTI